MAPLLLLGTTGFVLSLASGYTTWMGMTNFTGEAVLSLMVTFGIQGVMLIVAWLIGESFATGMSWQKPDGTTARNPAVDVTPAHLITGLITERGISPASAAGLAAMFPEFAR